MLKNISNLTKVFLLGAFSRGINKKRKNRFSTYILYGLLFAYLFGVFGYLSFEIIEGLIETRQEEAFIGLILMAIITVTMFTTIISTMNVLYFSDDNRFVLPLPLKPFEILTAKMNVLLIYVYLEEAMVGLVPLIVYGYMTKQSLIYYLFMIVVILVLPIVPLVISALIVIAVMAAFKGIRNKSLVQLLTMLVSVGFAVAVSMFSSSMSSDEDISTLMNNAGSLVEVYKKAFVTMPMAVDTLTKYSLVSLLLLCVISIAFYLLVCFFAQKLYYRGMLGSLYSSSGISTKKLNENSYHSRGLLFTYVMKELKVYLRNPVFLVQLILPNLVIPVLMICVTYFSMTSQGGGEILGMLKEIYLSGEYAPYIFAVLIIGILFLTMYCFISAVAISKDKNDAYAMKYLPVPFYKQLIYKMIPDILACLISYVISAVLLMVLFKMPPVFIICSVPVVLLYSILHGFLILSDVRRPKLNWSNEMEVAKKNLRMFISMVFAFINMGIVVVMAFFLHMGMNTLTIVLTLIYLVADVLLYLYIKKKDIALADGFE